MKVKKIYICAEKNTKGKYQDAAKQIYGGNIELCTKLEDAELVLAIQPVTEDMIADIDKVRVQKIRMLYMTEQFIPIQLYEDMLNNRGVNHEK
ncbi:MAG: hypothetical protein RR869_08710 [Lachnospiraceae bacterium]